MFQLIQILYIFTNYDGDTLTHNITLTPGCEARNRIQPLGNYLLHLQAKIHSSSSTETAPVASEDDISTTYSKLTCPRYLNHRKIYTSNKIRFSCFYDSQRDHATEFSIGIINLIHHNRNLESKSIIIQKVHTKVEPQFLDMSRLALFLFTFIRGEGYNF